MKALSKLQYFILWIVTLRHRPSLSRRISITMNEDPFLKKFLQQVQRAGQSSSGRGFSGGPRGFFTGSGLLIALVGGGFLLNASLFNGRWFCVSECWMLLTYLL
jgi:hypothetical protein